MAKSKKQGRKAKRKLEENEEYLKAMKNPLLEEQTKFLLAIPNRMKKHFFSNAARAGDDDDDNDNDNDNGQPHVTPEQRAEIWTQQADCGEKLINKYSWATPDPRAVQIIKHFAPVIEIGCGKNAYWANILHQCGIDVLAYDRNVHSGGTISIPSGDETSGKSNKKIKIEEGKQDSTIGAVKVKQGGPEVLSTDEIKASNRTLMLCYPDEDLDPEAVSSSLENAAGQTLGIQCLEHFQGNHIIHIGELYGDTLSMEQAPWGRSSSSHFQERLASEYHCLIRVALPNWLHVRDTISVWKRSERCSVIFAADSDDSEDEDEEVAYRHIPGDERLPVDIAATCVSHLLKKPKL